METTLRRIVDSALIDLFNLSEVSYSIEHPKELAHGDYAINVALVVSKELGKNPKEIADQLANYMDTHKGLMITSVQVAGPGFINITMAREVFIEKLAQIQAEGASWGHTSVYAGKKVVVEHSSPNLFKPFHIGHLMNNTFGEAITRLAKGSGAEVVTLSFPSDISLGVAKAVFVLLEKNYTPDDLTIKLLGDAYVEGTKRYEEDESIQVRVKEIADNLYAQTPSAEWDLFQVCKKLNIEYFESIVTKLGSAFDGYIFESEAGVDGKRLVLEHTPGVFIESEGAIVYTPDESKKLHTAVFINSQGNPTYEAKDLGLLHLKFAQYNPDISIVITDNQQTSHFQVVVDAAGKITPVWESNSLHRSTGRMAFKGQKMSSRLGGVPLVEDILATVAGEVQEKNPDVSNCIAEMIGIAALKFAILRAMAGKDINFDPETSLSFEGDSGPYLQYTAVRAASVLTKGLAEEITPDVSHPVGGSEILERLIARFPEVVALAQSEWMPHYIVGYLIELAQAFNSWYGQHKIIDDSKEGSAYRLAVVAATRQTIVNGLDILGIAVPEKM